MTAITDAQYSAMRAWVGTEPTDDELQDRYDRLGNFDLVVVETIEAKLAVLEEQPSHLSVPGLTISFRETITALQDAIKRFRGQGGLGIDATTSIGFSVTKVKRPDFR